MTLSLPGKWTLNTADATRDEAKRGASPCSYFYSQAQSLKLAADYFNDNRLTEQARGGVARKHRHRIHLALFGQLMAAFEYMLKDFVARAIDVTTVLDEALEKTDWLDLSTAKVLASRATSTTPGALLVHSTLGWHDPSKVNQRYKALFSVEPFTNEHIIDLDRLWILRHSVAHNAGFVTNYDASRMGSSELQDEVANIDAEFITETKHTLVPMAERVAVQVGGGLLQRWFDNLPGGDPDYERDKQTYEALKHLATMIKSRVQALEDSTEEQYLQDHPNG